MAPTTELKRCTRCKKSLPVAEFHRDRSRWDGLHASCKACNCDQAKEHYRAAERKSRIKIKYGLTVEEYDALIAKGCAICGTTEGKICMDHDHRNGKVRAALCNACNLSIGRMGDDPKRLRAAAEYIENFQREHPAHA